MKNLRKYMVVTIINTLIYLLVNYCMTYGKLELIHIPALVLIILFFYANTKKLPKE